MCHETAAHFLVNGELPDVDLAGRTPFGIELLKKQAEEGPPCNHVPDGIEPFYSGHGKPSGREYVKMCLEREKGAFCTPV